MVVINTKYYDLKMDDFGLDVLFLRDVTNIGCIKEGQPPVFLRIYAIWSWVSIIKLPEKAVLLTDWLTVEQNCSQKFLYSLVWSRNSLHFF
jgi:hypothetical protein